MSSIQKMSSKLIRYPILYAGKISHGLGRGSKQLGTPTANLAADDLPERVPNGIYYGFARIVRQTESSPAIQELDYEVIEQDLPLRHAVSGSSGHLYRSPGTRSLTSSARDLNTISHPSPVPKIEISPLYGFVACLADNQSQVLECKRLLEVHLLAKFGKDFYGATLRTSIYGMLRRERAYTSINQLIDDIHCDKRNVRRILAKEEQTVDPNLLL